MQILEQTPTRMVIRQRHQIMGFAVAIFILFSLLSLILLLWQGVNIFFTPDYEFQFWQILSFWIWIAFSVSFVGLGILIFNNMIRGTICILDRITEKVSIERPRWIRISKQEFPIYAVSHWTLQKLPEARSIAIFIVLRSGEQIPFVSVPSYEEENAQTLIREVRAFLKQ